MARNLDVIPARTDATGRRAEFTRSSHPGWVKAERDPTDTISAMGLAPDPAVYGNGGVCEPADLLRRASLTIGNPKADLAMLFMFRSTAVWAMREGWPQIVWTYR